MSDSLFALARHQRISAMPSMTSRYFGISIRISWRLSTGSRLPKRIMAPPWERLMTARPPEASPRFARKLGFPSTALAPSTLNRGCWRFSLAAAMAFSLGGFGDGVDPCVDSAIPLYPSLSGTRCGTKSIVAHKGWFVGTNAEKNRSSRSAASATHERQEGHHGGFDAEAPAAVAARRPSARLVGDRQNRGRGVAAEIRGRHRDDILSLGQRHRRGPDVGADRRAAAAGR